MMAQGDLAAEEAEEFNLSLSPLFKGKNTNNAPKYPIDRKATKLSLLECFSK
jgi:hypothetical protein